MTKTEKIHLAEIFKQDGQIFINCDDFDTNIFELLEFFRVYIRVMEKEIYDELKNNRSDDSR